MPTKHPDHAFPAPHNADFWTSDRRDILGAMLADRPPCEDGLFHDDEGTVFERFERAGEMAMIPYLRVTKGGIVVEAPLVRWAFVTFKEEPVE